MGGADKKKKTNGYLKYSGLAFQMMALLFIMMFLGQKVDAYFQLSQPFATIFLLLAGLCGFFYKIYIDLIK